MTTLRIILLSLLVVGFTGAASAQDEWPRVINSTNGSIIKVYEPQPESFSGNILKSRAAVSVQKDASGEPVFGTYWSVNMVETDRDNRRVSVQSARVPNIKFPDEVDAATISYVKTSLEAGLPAVETDLSLDVILTSIEANSEQKKLTQDISNKPPKIVYATTPSMLVTIDGEPKLKENKDWGVSVVVNTPFTIVKNNDGNYYLYGGKKWYTASGAKGPYSYVENAPANLSKVADAVNNQNNSDVGYTDSTDVAQSDVVQNIIVSTEPAELIQSEGDPSFELISGTNLQYVSNSQNDLFLDADAQQYYALLSGRWYKADKLNGSWTYVASNQLPADFSKIPEGSPKDNVLASVPGTSAAREAVMDAQIPQTAKVDRREATTSVTYDGAPRFDKITGTNLTYAVNTQSSVLGYNGRYYSVDKGVWFVADNPNGPWQVSTDRPEEVESIPPSNPNYNLKYVYVYDSTPDYVYMGYTPGYLNNYVYGGTVIYGTGYNYAPWWGNYYYARPYTWGFGVSYNPWWGWNLGFGFGYNWFNMGFGYYGWSGWGGGWWGPSIYRPPFRYYGGGYRGGYYGHGYGGYGGGRVIAGGGRGGRPVSGGRYGGGMNGGRSINNIYHFRNDVVTSGGRNNGANGGRAMNNGGGFNGNNGGRMSSGAAGGRQDFNNGGNRGGNGFSNGMNNSGMNNGGRAGGGGQGARADAGGRVFTDNSGNVYQRGNQGQWQQRGSQGQWNQVGNDRRETIQNLNRQQQQQNRGEQRTQNFQQYRNSAPSGGYSRPSGGSYGGGRPSGGGAPSGGGGGGRSGGGGGGGRGGRH